MGAHSISGIDDITPAWLTDVYTDTGLLKDHCVTDVELSNVGVGRGYVSQTVMIKATYSDIKTDSPVSAVGKIPSIVGFPEDIQDAVGDILDAEVNWYKFAAEECPARVPTCYTADYESPDRYIVLLEDLSAYRTLNQADELDDDLAILIVRSLARIHAHWWQDAGIQKSSWLRTPAASLELWRPLIEAGWTHFVEDFASNIDPAFIAVGEKFVKEQEQVILRGVDTSGTMVHGDFRSENFLIGNGTSDDDLVILDWQLCNYGSGLYDLGYFIGQSLSTEKRRTLEAQLLDVYYKELLKGGVANFSEHQFKEDYKLGLLGALMIPINGAKISKELVPPDESAPEIEHQQFREAEVALNTLMRLMAERSIHAVMDNNAGDVL